VYIVYIVFNFYAFARSVDGHRGIVGRPSVSARLSVIDF